MHDGDKPTRGRGLAIWLDGALDRSSGLIGLFCSLWSGHMHTSPPCHTSSFPPACTAASSPLSFLYWLALTPAMLSTLLPSFPPPAGQPAREDQADEVTGLGTQHVPGAGGEGPSGSWGLDCASAGELNMDQVLGRVGVSVLCKWSSKIRTGQFVAGW